MVPMPEGTGKTWKKGLIRLYIGNNTMRETGFHRMSKISVTKEVSSVKVESVHYGHFIYFIISHFGNNSILATVIQWNYDDHAKILCT